MAHTAGPRGRHSLLLPGDPAPAPRPEQPRPLHSLRAARHLSRGYQGDLLHQLTMPSWPLVGAGQWPDSHAAPASIAGRGAGGHAHRRCKVQGMWLALPASLSSPCGPEALSPPRQLW